MGLYTWSGRSFWDSGENVTFNWKFASGWITLEWSVCLEKASVKFQIPSSSSHFLCFELCSTKHSEDYRIRVDIVILMSHFLPKLRGM